MRIAYKRKSITIKEIIQNDYKIILQRDNLRLTELIYKVEPMDVAFRISTAQKPEKIKWNKVYTNVGDALNDVSQLDIKGLNIAGERQNISLGGFSPRHTIVMLDNIVLNPSGEAVDLSTIPASRIESVEVVKNNASVDAGSGGIAGMVILRTKPQEMKNSFYLSESYGSYNSYKHSSGIRRIGKYSSLSADFSFLSTDNNFKYKDRNETLERKNNKKEIYNVSGGFEFNKNKSMLSTNIHYQDFYKELPGTTNYLQLYKGAFQKGNSTHFNQQLSQSFDVMPKRTNFDFQYNLIINNSLYENTKAPIIVFRSKDKNEQKIGSFKTALKQDFGIGNIMIGTEYKNESFKVKDVLYNRNNINKINRITKAGFSAITLKKDIDNFNFNIIGSSRIDDVNDLSTQSSYRFEFNTTYYGRIPINLKSNIGNSFMVPSFYEMYYKGDSQTSGNIELKPEDSIGWRMEAELESNPSLSAAIWQNKTKNLIYWNRSILGWKPFNMNESQIDNYELATNYYFLNKQSIKIEYIRTIAKNKTKGDLYNKYLIYTPSYHWNISQNLAYKKLSQSVIYNAKGRQWTTLDQLIAPLKAYELYSTKSVYETKLFNIDTLFMLSVNNVFDKKYNNYYYIPEPGRHYEISIGVQF
jgi:outer membrane cobalamin receptor